MITERPFLLAAGGLACSMLVEAGVMMLGKALVPTGSSGKHDGALGGYTLGSDQGKVNKPTALMTLGGIGTDRLMPQD